MEFKCAHSHFYIISPLNVCASIYYLLKIQPAGCYKHGTLLAVFTHRYGCCRNSLAGSGPGFQELLCFTKQGSLFIQICVCVCLFSHSVVSGSFQPHGQQPTSPSAHGIFQARTLERVAISFSRGSSQPGD